MELTQEDIKEYHADLVLLDLENDGYSLDVLRRAEMLDDFIQTFK